MSYEVEGYLIRPRSAVIGQFEWVDNGGNDELSVMI